MNLGPLLSSGTPAMDHDDHIPWLDESRLLLAAARGDPQRVAEAVRKISLVAFRQWRFSPAIVFDYFFVSTPGLFGEAGSSDAEVNLLMPQIESCVESAWAHRAAESLANAVHGPASRRKFIPGIVSPGASRWPLPIFVRYPAMKPPLEDAKVDIGFAVLSVHSDPSIGRVYFSGIDDTLLSSNFFASDGNSNSKVIFLGSQNGPSPTFDVGQNKWQGFWF